VSEVIELRMSCERGLRLTWNDVELVETDHERAWTDCVETASELASNVLTVNGRTTKWMY